MKIEVLGCHGGQLPGRNNTALLLNNDTLIDAGTIALTLGIEKQRKIRNAFISHAHLDHTGALPFFAVNIVSNKTEGVKIYGAKSAVDAVKTHLMNNVIWPDFTKIKNFGGNPVFEYKPLPVNKWIKAGEYKIKLIPVNHTVPTTGMLIGHKNRYLLYSGDTKETSGIWKEAGKLGSKLKAVFVETAFPDSLAFLGEASGHLVPSTLKKQLDKLGPKQKPKIFVYHVKPEYVAQVKKELSRIRGRKIRVLDEGGVYTV
ncbi:MAG TPA: 3',5'-cyclic-nucleotide phosphodiesterase [bacterium]|nr:3',5'-cyclic-nucleotide phosphodiesterase [bacterium]